MGKRKRIADRNNTPPASMPHASHMESSLTEQKPSHSIGLTGVNSMSSSLMNIMERSPNAHHRHHNLNRALLLRLPRHYFNIQNSQRNSANHSGSSTSNAKSTTPEDKLSLKLGHRSESGSGYHAERKEKASRRPERIKSSTLVVDSLSPDVMKMLCGLCQRMLKRKPCILESAISSTDLSVVAVLVCGHVYHADCLERRTPNEYKRDPPCPLCTSPAIGT